MTSLETLKQIATLMLKAKDAQSKLMTAYRRIVAIQHEHSQYHRDKLGFQVYILGKTQERIEKQFQQILSILRQYQLMGRQPKQFSDGDPFRNDITPKAGSASVALRYPPKQRSQQVLI